MSWASRRRSTYLIGVVLFFIVIIGGPISYWYFTIPQTCFDGIQNQGETAIDKGGPCAILDERYLQPYSVMWARAFKVRDLPAQAGGLYTAAAYVENPNPQAGVEVAHYHVGLYDSGNILIAERTGTMFIMPGGITPVIETGIDTGNKVVVHTYFQITDHALIWKRLSNAAADIHISNQKTAGVQAQPQVSATITNASLDTVRDLRLIAVVFDPSGNAFAASATAVPEIVSQAQSSVTFSWPAAFAATVGKIDIIPLLPPAPLPQ